MSDAETRRVSTTLPLEIDGKARPVGTELTLPSQAAQDMVDAGRALWCGEPLDLTDEERAALPPLEAAQVDAPAEAVTGYGPAGSAPSAHLAAGEEDAPIIAPAAAPSDPTPRPADPAPQPQEA